MMAWARYMLEMVPWLGNSSSVGCYIWAFSLVDMMVLVLALELVLEQSRPFSFASVDYRLELL
jgi:hypothetical protein